MENKIEIFKSVDNETEIRVQIDVDTVWITQNQMVKLFDSSKANISEHINRIFSEGELMRGSTVRKFRTVQEEGKRKVNREIDHYNLDIIISVGYRVNSKRGIQFRQWATQRLKDYLVQGYAINERRLEQKQQEVNYLKTGIRIMNRVITEQTTGEEFEMLRVFAKGLELLDDYDHGTLDKNGRNKDNTNFPSYKEYMDMINTMHSEFQSDVFAKPKDESFHSSINQIKQSFDGVELYPTIEEKAANLLYFITKNHSFIDGNKRIAAACFIYFLKKNNSLLKPDGLPIIDNATLAALTLFIANSKSEESEVVKQLAISILNRSIL
ncbi:MAG: virulence protein RhuM/Fic/DOC family protein [Prolixibacteraceae bacterium]|nr:virulence protein RhuM/Fic/DOC family protein [Prolixibacteraceae bacterium]